MEANKENNGKSRGRKPKTNRAIHRYGIKLTDDENAKFNSLFLQSGMNKNVEAKTVKGEGIDSKPFNGIIYSATDDTGKAVSNPF
jgi:hypothetical protein